MKHLLTLFSILLIGGLYIQCNDQKAPTSTGDESITTLNKAIIDEGEFDYDFEPDAPYSNCVTGALMKNHGVLKLYFKAIITPSGTYKETGYVDYNAYGGITLENLSTGEIWTLQNGTDHWSWIEFHNSSFRYHYLWNELYKLGNHNLHIHSQGYFAVDKNGNVTRVVENISCN
jgi:hypothetical protein